MAFATEQPPSDVLSSPPRATTRTEMHFPQGCIGHPPPRFPEPEKTHVLAGTSWHMGPPELHFSWPSQRSNRRLMCCHPRQEPPPERRCTSHRAASGTPLPGFLSLKKHTCLLAHLGTWDPQSSIFH